MYKWSEQEFKLENADDLSLLSNYINGFNSLFWIYLVSACLKSCIRSNKLWFRGGIFVNVFKLLMTENRILLGINFLPYNMFTKLIWFSHRGHKVDGNNTDG